MQLSSALPLTGLRTHSSVFQRRAERAILQAGSCQDDWHLTLLLPFISFSVFQSEQLGAFDQGSGFQLCSSGAARTRSYLPEWYEEDLGTFEGTTHFTRNNSNLPRTSFLILTTTQRGRYHCPHFTDELRVAKVSDFPRAPQIVSSRARMPKQLHLSSMNQGGGLL